MSYNTTGRNCEVTITEIEKEYSIKEIEGRLKFYYDLDNDWELEDIIFSNVSDNIQFKWRFVATVYCFLIELDKDDLYYIMKGDW